MSRIPDPPPFHTDLAILKKGVPPIQRDLSKLPPVSRFIECEAEARAVSSRIIATGQAMRSGPRRVPRPVANGTIAAGEDMRARPRHVIRWGVEAAPYGSRLRVTTAMRQDAWDLVAFYFGRHLPLTPLARIAFAYATGVDGIIGRRDRLDGLIQVMAYSRSSGIGFTHAQMLTRASIASTLAAQEGLMTWRHVQGLWHQHREILEARIVQYVDLHNEVRNSRLVAGTTDWRTLYRDTVGHERDEVSATHVPLIVGGMESTSVRHGAQYRAIARHCTYLLVTHPDVAGQWDKAIIAAAAVLSPAGEV